MQEEGQGHVSGRLYVSGTFWRPMDSSNYRHRILHKLARELDLPKLTFQVIRRTIATLARPRSRQGYSGHDAALQGLDDNGRLYAVSRTRSAYGINSIYSELVGTGTTGPTPERPATFGPNAAGREADHGVFTQARSSTMEPKNGSGREENQTAAVPSRGKICILRAKCGQAIWRGTAKLLSYLVDLIGIEPMTSSMP